MRQEGRQEFGRTLNILRKMNQDNITEQLDNRHEDGSAEEDSEAAHHDYRNISRRLKIKLLQEYKSGHLKHLGEMYTDLYVVENVTRGKVYEHEVMRIEAARQFAETDTQIQCKDIFKSHRDTGEQNRNVLTIGISGVGKTISVNKFILDWAEERENQDILFIFPLPFRRLKMIRTKCSLMGLLNKYFFSDPEELSSLPEDDGKVMFIFDGLDECHFPLSFKKGNSLTDVHKKTTVSKIVTNLIKRDLVSSALIWITSRPAAAGLIPRDYIDQVLEVRGFNDEQKEQYFINNSSPEVAGNIIRHIRNSRSLNIMCQIPIFCWISLTVLQPPLARESNDKTPTTLTEMYTTFLLSQKQKMERKYNPELRPQVKSFDQTVLKLGKWAFKQLQKGNQIFYQEDLEECGLDVSEGSVLSGLCTQIFQEEKSVSERKVYSFIHLSVQEFLAALFVFFKYKCNGRNAFLQSERINLTLRRSKAALLDVHKAVIDKALQSQNGHLDLFLRFLLGLSLESSQKDLKELLPELKLKPENLKGTADYIKNTIEKEKSVEMIINLLYCLDEMKEDFAEEIQNDLSSGNLSAQRLSSAQWSALVFIRMMSGAQRLPVSTRRLL
ncbi:protein NLRC3-like [Carassius carassius]|uniref:protein NLRC3-like n=1 Tax=Carassius carassius TaxID=217509 RepID=UPI00286946CE|nr:protein NLRC3-like [Carassius carassius]